MDKLELIKKTDWDGTVWYHVKVNGWSEYAKKSLKEAEKKYAKLKKQLQCGDPKIEVLKSEEL